MSKLYLTSEENAFKKFKSFSEFADPHHMAWSDMIIEQSLMKHIKTESGIAGGRTTKC